MGSVRCVDWMKQVGHFSKMFFFFAFSSSVRLGEYDLSTDVDCFRGECIPAPVNIPVEQLITHEKFLPTSKSPDNDIALIRLSRPVHYSSN